ncbi:unnamed protein product [Caenorhabditis brenneri]
MSSMWPDYVESSCRQNSSFFSTTDYLRNAYHCTALVSVTLSLFTFYAILRVTPPRMKNMKTPLLIAHAWSTNLDLVMTVCTAPMLFFPSASGNPLGILGSLGVPVKWQAYWGQVSIALMGICFLMLYENRQSQIPTIKFKIKSMRVRQVYFGVNYFMAFAAVLPFYLEDSDQMELRRFVLKRIPCPAIEFFDTKTYVLLKGAYNNNAMLLMATHGILSTICTLLIYQPYRNLIKHIISGKREDENRKASMATSSYLSDRRRSTNVRAIAAAEVSN